MIRLAGSRALVTGSSSGIGAGVARAFAAAGADVVINYPTAAQADQAAAVKHDIETHGRRCLAVEADVSQEAEVQRLFDAANGFLNGIEILVNNAGIAETAAIHEMSVASWDRMLAIHLRSVFLLTRLVLPQMYRRDGGRIINTASQLAYKGAPGYAHYTAAKAGIIGFTRSLALELGQRNITANCVGPGATDTPLLGGATKELLEAIRRYIPKGRFAQVAEIVPAYLFLASAEASFVQGQCLSPNGGDVFL
ncbi:MAG: SDR family oxidoreductase [Alphaproteobacteria bacterium]|nr:SDR family oxidoreductase [Alphaproteobacteria bacterium]